MDLIHASDSVLPIEMLHNLALIFLFTCLALPPPSQPISTSISVTPRVRPSASNYSQQIGSLNVSGSQKSIVILVDFNDTYRSKSIDQINNTMSQANSYWEEVSHNRINLVWTFAGWYRLNNSLEYYGTDVGGLGSDAHGYQLLRDAVLAADYDVDYRNFAHIMVVHAGMDQRLSNLTSDLWPHFCSGLNVPTDDGITVEKALYVAEFARLNAYVHEFAHSLGLPDFHPLLTSSQPELVRNWSLMDSGEWLGSPPGSSPSGLEAWSMIRLGWTSPLQITSLGNAPEIRLNAMETQNDPRAVELPISNTLFYLIELREKIGVDQAQTSDGLVISLINTTALRGYDGYGLVNVTSYLPTSFVSTYPDVVRQIFVQLSSCANYFCIISLASRAINVVPGIVPREAEIFVPVEIQLNFSYWNGTLAANLPVEIYFENQVIRLTTSSIGQVRTDLQFHSLGNQAVRLLVPGILTNGEPFFVQVDASWLFLLIGLAATGATVIVLRRRKSTAYLRAQWHNLYQ